MRVEELECQERERHERILQHRRQQVLLQCQQRVREEEIHQPKKDDGSCTIQ